LNIDYIDPIPDKKPEAGSVVDFGKFSEGFCIKINTKIPTKKFIQTEENIQPAAGEFTVAKWIVCVETKDQKDKLCKLIIDLKLKRQHERNIYIDIKNKDSLSASGNDSNNINKMLEGKKLKTGSIYEGGENAKDCKMIILQDWTPCNLACGGGLSFLQLMKVDAKEGGKPCKTNDTILKRECNSHACPTQAQITGINSEIKKLQDLRTQNNKILSVKTVRISNRPQRYDKCYLKETDALMEKRDDISLQTLSTNVSKNLEFPLIPVRLVMNDKTITAYQDDNLINKISTYLLDESNFIKTDDIRRCFIIKNNISSAKFCMIDASKGDFLEEWFYDFNLFKHQCRKERVKSDKYLVEEKKMEKEYKEKVDKLKMEILQNKAEAVKKTFEEEEKKKLEKKIHQFRKMSFSAMEKELRLEDLLEKEEESREQGESETLEQQISQEKKKEQTLIKAIREKELESQLNVAKSQAEKAILDIRKNTQAQILKQRQLVAKKIIEMRQKRKRKDADLKNQILTIRSNIADRLKNINRKGDQGQCLDFKNIESYCNKYFADSFVKMGDCKTKESFCYVCCENEFGELHVLERDQCYTSCDKI